MRQGWARVGAVSKRKKTSQPEVQNPIPPVDEQEFTDVICKMVNTSPVTRKEVEHRGKNPETDPRYLPVFDFSRIVGVEHKPKKK